MSLRREPSETELNDALGMCMDAKTPVAPAAPPTAKDWQYGYGSYDETSQRTRQFDLLPHFTGSAYQGSAQWPDAKHGWAQLTADGGHPGNTREHACIRRWIAPREMDIEIQSKFVHNAPQGDGVRAFIVSSKHGRLAMEKLHQQSNAMAVESRRVQAGETIDFLVDIDQVLNSDQFLWDITVREVDGARWHAASDFPNHAPTRLTPIEQLAHILLCTNEFFFVD